MRNFLARYAGQRRSDLVNMRWDHIDSARDEMFVAQVKTGARIWVPMPKRLRDHLETSPRRGDYIVMSSKAPGKPWRETSLTNEFIRVTRELGFSTTDSMGEPRYYSPHGLRHLCGVELAHAGASDRQIAAVLGHSTLKQVQVYSKPSSACWRATRNASAMRCTSAKCSKRRSKQPAMSRGCAAGDQLLLHSLPRA